MLVRARARAKRLAALALSCAVLGGFVQGVSASPIFDSSAADVWVVDADGVTQGSYSVGEGAWTLSASPTTLTEAKVSVVAAPDALIPFQMASGGGVIVNQAAHSYPNVMGGSLGFSLKGLEAAASSLVDPMQPSVSIDPVGGFYENTLRVLLVALPGATNPEPVMLHWRVGEGALQSVEASEASFFLFEPGDHVVQYHVSQGVGHATAPVTETYQIDPAIDRMRDSDADGLPDAWEIAHGLDPLSSDAGQDRDGDGTSDFDEILRGTDPDDSDDSPTNLANDPDCDGWSTWDEEARGTLPDPAGIPVDLDNDGVNDSCEPARPWPSRPVARRLAEVEYVLAGGVWEDLAHGTPKTSIGRLSVMDPYGEVLFDQAALPDLPEIELPPWLRAIEIAAPLANGTLPPARVPGGNASIVRAHDEDAGGVPGLWVAKAWLNPSRDRTPAAYNDYVRGEIDAGNDLSWTTAAQWQTGYEAWFRDGLVEIHSLDLDPASGLTLSLLEAAASWYAERNSSGGELLLGNPDVDSSRDAVSALGETLASQERSLESLLADFQPLVEPAGDLAGFRSSVLAYFADPSTIPPPEADYTTEIGAASLVQGKSSDDDVLAAYIAKLYTGVTPQEIAALDPVQAAALMDPIGDADGDGITNVDEVAVKASQSGDPADADSDGDGFADGIDPCIADPDNTCLALTELEADDDGDGVVNALDNCMNDANAQQEDANGDAIGDACLRYANIRTPVANVRVYPGASINFTSVVTELGAAAVGPLSYAWNFSGGAADASSANPGPIRFDLPGTWPVALTVRDAANADLGADLRNVTVLGDVPLVAIVGAAPIVEGDSLSLLATASSPNGAITDYDWDFGDGQADNEAAVSHSWVQDGSYTLSVSVQDVIGAPATDSLVLAVADTEPQTAFTLNRDRGPAPHAVQFTDVTPLPYDGLAGLVWNFGDGSPADTSSSPTHVFSAPATRDVQLSATDGDGSVALASQRVQVLTDFNLLADADGDGLADTYELSRGIANPAADSDGDGMSDGVEYRAASDPNDATDTPPGTVGVSTLLFADGFDAPLEERWSQGLASALAAPSVVADAGRVSLGIQQPLVDELCQTASLVAFPTVDGVDLEISVRMDPGAGGRSCVGLARQTDYFARVEACLVESPTGFTAELRRVEGDDHSVVSAGNLTPIGDVEIGLQKRDSDFYLTLSGMPVASQASSGSLGDSGLRVYASAESCPEDAAMTQIDLDFMEVTQLPEADAALQLLAGFMMLKRLARRRRGPSPSSPAV